VIEAYRLHPSRYPANSGKGAAVSPGRWNHEGIEAIYTAQSRSLAALEILVHYSVLPKSYMVAMVRIPDSLVREVSRLPQGWKTNLAWSRDFGTSALRTDCVISVPSSVIPAERNYVLNPAHPQFNEIEFLASERFHFDPRLK
jgi:RES domain-containing protein